MVEKILVPRSRHPRPITGDERLASLILKVEYAELPFISDRTARAILKDVSKAVRRAQVAEIEHILRVAEVGRRDRQSINDRLRRPIQECAVYYVEDLHAGSLYSTLTISAVGIWLLNATIGETVSDVWKLLPVHEAIIEYVENHRSDVFPKILKDELKSKDLLAGRAHVTSVEIHNEGDNTTIQVYIGSDSDAEINADTKIEGQDVIESAKAALERLANQPTETDEHEQN